MSLRGRRHGGGRKNELVFLTTCGPSTTFDPKIIGVDGVWYFDDGTTLAAASGVEISKTFAAEGLHRAIFRPASGGLAAITAIDCNTDLITKISGLRRTSATSLIIYANAALQLALSEFPYTLSVLNSQLNTVLYGNVLSLPRNMTSLILNASPAVVGAISDVPPNLTSYLNLGKCTLITGSVTDIPATCVYIYLYETSVTAGSISHLTFARDIRIYSCGWLTADVDTVLKSIPDSSYATPVLQIGGTNQAPSGAAWQEPADPSDPESWTGLEAIWMANHKANPWTITFNGGVSEDSLLGNVIGTGEKTWDQTNTRQHLYMTKFVAVAGTIGDIRVRSLGSANVKVAIYDDDGVGGVPGALLAYSTGVAVVAGWNTIQLNVPVPLTAGNYYLAVKTDTSGRIQRVSSGGKSCHNTSVLYADDFTNPAPAMINGSYDIAIAGWGLKVV